MRGRNEAEIDESSNRRGGFMHFYGSFENFRRFSMHVLGSQTENFLSQKGQRSFCLNCQILYILSLGCQISFTICQN